MPNGYGVQDLSAVTTAAAASLAKPTASQSDDLARAAIDAVGALAAAAGHRLAPSGSSSTADHGDDPSTLVLVAVVLAAIAAAATLIALRATGRSSWPDRFLSGGAYAAAARRSSGARGTFAYGLRAGTLQPLLVAGLALIFAGLMWAVARGLQFYGLSPVAIGYDLDQPPLLLVLVGAWLWYRSARR